MKSFSSNIGIIVCVFLYSAHFVTSIELDNGYEENQVFAESYRLPLVIVPNSYVIALNVYLDSKDDFTFNGVVTIKSHVVQSTNKITLHRGKIKFLSSNFMVGTNDLKIINETYDKIVEQHTFHFNSVIPNNTDIKIVIKYEGVMADNMKGLYKSSYLDGEQNLKWLAATQFQTIYARNVFPCLDEPSYKANFTIQISRPKSLSSLSNMPLDKTITTNFSETEWDIYKSSIPMSTYLVAFVISDFVSLGATIDDIEFKVWTAANFLNQTQYALSIGPKALKYLSILFNQKYQLPKLDMVAIPDFSPGAMENWGIITYKEARLLYDRKESSDAAKQTTANIIVHELTHMWFGNLVTPAWWGYLWLAEGFARYFQFFATNKIEPTWKMDKQFVVDVLQTIFFADGLSTSKALDRQVNSREEVNSAGDTITYSKGASIIRMMNLIFGADVFDKALRSYLNKNQYDSATPSNLWQSIQDEINAAEVKINSTVVTIMGKWTSQPGYPIITVKKNSDNITFSVTQERFFIRNPDSKSTKSTWWNPLTWTTKTDKDFKTTSPKYWLSKVEDKISINVTDDDWIIFNIQQAGYYRVNYDKELWYRIINTLNSENFEEIEELNRAAVVDDLLNLARAEKINYNEALNGLKYLTKERSFFPIKSALNNLEYLHKRFMGRLHYDIFANFMLKLITPVFEELGFEDRSNDDHLTILLRRLINKWVCKLGHQKCIDKSLEYFSSWQNASKPIPKNQKSTVYCTAIKHGTEEHWNTLWNHYLTTNIASEKPDILIALACTQDETILESYLSSAISNFTTCFIRKQDSETIFNAVAENSLLGAEFLLDFIDDHYQDLKLFFDSENVIADIISTASKSFSTDYHYEVFSQFIMKNIKNVYSLEGSLNNSLNLVEFELDWYERNYGEIIEWIENYNNEDLGYRLPSSILPETYDIYLIPFMNNFTFDGEVEIRMKVNQVTSRVIMHSNKLTIKGIEARSDLSQPLTVEKHEVNSTTNKLTIYLSSTLKKGVTLHLNIKYSGIINDEMEGFYRSYYYDDSGNIHWLGTTQFEKFGARQAFPCFDEPAFKAKFTVNIQRPNSHHSISNMPLLNSVPCDELNRTWDTFEPSPTMSSYLVAFVISDFESKTSKDEKFKVWARPNAVHDAEISLNVGQDVLKVLELYTGILYPIGKMEFAAIPDFAAGAMENWGLVTYREYGLLADEYKTSGYYMRSMYLVIAHELTHMWFGNLVTCDWWKYLWLNEGFAEFFEWVSIAAIQPEWRMMDQFIIYDLHPSLLADSYPYMRPMNNEMKTPYDSGRNNNNIVYGKSASVIHMMWHAFGQDVLADGLQMYLNENQYSTGKPEYLWSALQKAVDKSNSSFSNTNETVSSLMDSWTNQPGYPIITASYLAGTLILLQERFLFSERNNLHDELYWVPINYATKSNPNFDDTNPMLWLGERGVELKNTSIKDDEWYIINKKQSGFYRVNYDEKNWNNLMMAMNLNNHSGIDEINRAQIIDDLFNLARGGYISYELCLKGTSYLYKERNHLPWKAFFNSIQFLYEQFTGGSNDIIELLGNYTIQLAQNIYDQYNFTGRENNHTFIDQLQKETILTWLCKFNYAKCVNDSKTHFTNFRDSEKYIISPDAKPAVFCTAMRHGNYDDWVFLWQQYRSSNLESEKIVILGALGCSRNTTALNTYLTKIFSKDKLIRDQNIGTALSSIYSTDSIGLNFTLEFLINNYTDIYKFYEDWDQVGRSFTNVISKFTTTAQIKLVESFLKEESSKIKEIVKKIEDALDEAKDKIKWSINNFDTIEKWLKNPTKAETDPDKPGFANSINPCLHLIIATCSLIIFYIFY